MKILVVEDEPKVVEILRNFFTARGHEVLTSETGAGALEQLERHRPRIVLLDWWLKDKISGREILRETKTRFAGTTVIVVSGFEELTQEDVVAQGGYALLKKPIALDQLDALVQRAVGARPPGSPSAGAGAGGEGRSGRAAGA